LLKSSAFYSFSTIQRQNTSSFIATKSLICKYLSFSCSSGSDAGWTKQIRTHVQTGSGAEAAGDAAAAVGAAGAAQLDGSGHQANADLAGLPASISKYEH